MRLQSDTGGLFVRLVGLAERQWGVVTFVQLKALGASQAWISRQLGAGRLHRVHRGVYSVVPPSLISAKGRWLAAVLACGDRAVLSHTNAAALWDLCAIPSGPINVTVPTTSGRRKRSGIAIHRSRTLLSSQTTVEYGIPVTSPRRTIADLRAMLPPARIKSLIRKAQIRHLDVGPVPGEPPPAVERSELARRFIAVTRRHGLPAPMPEQIIGRYTVDFLWPEQRLSVEVDGWQTHGTKTAFEDDRARDAFLTSQGYRVVRFTWRQVTREGPWVAKTLRGLLA
jgi:hypothetical protein